MEGPEPRQVETPSGTVTVDVFDAEVTFTYLGQEFDVTGNYALVDDEMRWFTACG